MKQYQVHTAWLNSDELAKEVQRRFQSTIGLDVFLTEKDDHKYTEDIICPYCGYKDIDTLEIDEKNREIKCPDCGNFFAWCKHISVQYLTYKVCNKNNHDHEWSEWKDHSTLGYKFRVCEGCNEIEKIQVI